MSTDSNGRLPLVAIPSHYDLRYDCIDLKRHVFEGTVTIALKGTGGASGITALKNCIVLHALELQCTKASLKAESISHDAVEFVYVKKEQIVKIIFAEGEDDSSSSPSIWQPNQEYTLEIKFHGILNDYMRGLYRSTYTVTNPATGEKEQRTMATTQFEPTDARLAFPCFDEPALKATFALTVDKIASHLQCISTTIPASIHTSEDAKTKTVSFQQTPKMSTYLLAIIIGEFDSISQTSTNIPVTTTIYTMPGKAKQAQFCLETATKALDLYQSIFYSAKYPLPKSDLIAIPDFAAGAMENYGAVTYREAKILISPGNTTSESLKRGIARTVCHELAHMWFGNHVTMEFWTQLWLKEGVARFLEFVGIDHVFGKEAQVWTEFVQGVYGLAMSLDAMQTTHPVEVPVKSADEIHEIFDAISYAKGASLIRMASNYIGMDAFFRGMNAYLTKFGSGNAVTVDFWQCLADATDGIPLVDFMTPWTSQEGFPILRLSPDSSSIAVSRFLVGGPDGGDPDKDGSKSWPIPVTAQVEGLEGVQGPWVLNGPGGDETSALQDKIQEWIAAGKWFKLNVDQCGFYRVQYTQDQLDKLAQVMDPESGPLSTTDRLGLIADCFAVGKAGYAPVTQSLSFIRNFGKHNIAEYPVWQEIYENLAGMASLYRSEDFFPKFQQYLFELYSKQMSVLGWDTKPDETARTGSVRASVIGMMAASEDAKTVEQGFGRFMKYCNDPTGNPIPGDLRHIIFKLALRHDEETVYPLVKALFEKSTLPEEQRDCLSVLGRVKDRKRIEAVYEYALFSGKVRQQDMAFPIQTLAATTDWGAQYCWSNLKDNFHMLYSKFGASPVWASLIGLSSRYLQTTEDAKEVEEFFAQPDHPAGTGQRRLNQGLEAVRTRVARLDRDKDQMKQFLDAIYS